MKLFSNLSSKRNTNNCSLSTIQYKKKDNNLYGLINQQNNKGRYSYQQNLQLPLKLQRNSSYHDISSSQNNKFSIISQIKYFCFNHKNIQASHCALQNTQDPLYCCKRCAILIASKGFDINPIFTQTNTQSNMNKQNNINQRNKSNNNLLKHKRGSTQNISNNLLKNKRGSTQNISNNLLKHKRGSTQNISKPKKILFNNNIKEQLKNIWNSTKQSRKQSLFKIDECIENLTQSIKFIQQFYYTIHEQIQKNKKLQIAQIITKKQSIQNIKKQTNNYYLIYLSQIKKIQSTLLKQGQYSYDQYQNTIKKIHKDNLKLNIDQISFINDIKSYKIKSKKQIANLCNHIIDIIKDNYHLNQNNNQNLNSNTDKLKKINRNQSGTLSINSSVNNSNFLCSIKQTNSIPSSRVTPSKSLIPIKSQKIIQKNQQNQQSSIRSLQLSFDEMDSDSELLYNTTNRQQSINFTLNKYLNQNKSEQSSYMTNLLLTSTEI